MKTEYGSFPVLSVVLGSQPPELVPLKMLIVFPCISAVTISLRPSLLASPTKMDAGPFPDVREILAFRPLLLVPS